MTTSETLLTVGRLGGGLLVVIALVLISGRVAKRLRGQSGASGLRVVDRIVLSKEAHLAVVETGGRRLLLGVTPQHVTMIGPLDDGGMAPEAEAVLEPEAVIAAAAVPEAAKSALVYEDKATAQAEAEAEIQEEPAAVEPVTASASTGFAISAELADVADVADVASTVPSAGHGRRALHSDVVVDGASEPADESASAGGQIPAQRRSERIRAERQARHEQAEHEAELKAQFEATQEAAAQAESARLLAEAKAATQVAKSAPSVGWLRTPQTAYQATDQATHQAAGQTAGPEQHDADQRERHEAERLLALREIAEREAELAQRAAAAAAKTPNFSGHPDLASALRAAGRTLPSGTAGTTQRLPLAGPATVPAAQPTSGGTQPVAQLTGQPAQPAAGPTSPAVPVQPEQASGSVLSPATWRQGIEALRELTARRG